MPRPKRAKVASAEPTRRVASTSKATNYTKDSVHVQTTRRGAKQDDTSDDIPPISNPEQRSQHNGQNGAPKGKGRPAPKKIISSIADTSAIERLKRRRDKAMNANNTTNATSSPRAGPPPAEPETKVSSAKPSPILPSSRPLRTSSNKRTSSVALIRESTPQAAQSPSLTEDLYGLSPQGEQSQLELQEKLKAGRGSLGQQQKAPVASLGRGGTPAHEASILALTNFKRRTRQPSILRTRHDQSTLNIDTDLDDFNPDDESTPLKLSGPGVDESSAVKAKTSSSRKRKLASPDVQIPRSSPPVEDPIVIASDAEDEGSERSSLPEQIPETAANTQNVSEQVWSETMAPPKSSSSLEELNGDDTAVEDNQRSVTIPRRNPRKGGAQPVVKSVKSTKTKPARPPALSTAALQGLLPRRKRRAKRAKQDAFDIPSSDQDDELDDDSGRSSDDELSRPNNRLPKSTMKRKTGAVQTPSRKVRTVKAKAKSPLSVQRNSARKKITPLKGKKTYGRQAVTSDKENDESIYVLDDGQEDRQADDSAVHGNGKNQKGAKAVEKSAELAAVAKKFAEVDEWEMEFESVDLGKTDSSSWR